MNQWIYIDVDGTLTMDGVMDIKVARVVQALYDKPGITLVVWSARGGTYAREWCLAHGLKADFFLTKPHVCLDDNPKVNRKTYRHVYPKDAEKLL